MYVSKPHLASSLCVSSASLLCPHAHTCTTTDAHFLTALLHCALLLPNLLHGVAQQSCSSEVLLLIRALCNDGLAEHPLAVVRRLLSTQRTVLGIVDGFIACGGGKEQLAALQALARKSRNEQPLDAGGPFALLNCMSMIMSGCPRYPEQIR